MVFSRNVGESTKVELSTIWHTIVTQQYNKYLGFPSNNWGVKTKGLFGDKGQSVAYATLAFIPKLGRRKYCPNEVKRSLSKSLPYPYLHML